MPSEYQKAHETFRQLQEAATGGDAAAMKEKHKVMKDIIAIERDAAKEGTLLTPIYKADKVIIETEKTSSKRSLQEEYVRKFDGETVVNVGGKEQTLQQFHAERLLGA